jgi:hypothetical protein
VLGGAATPGLPPKFSYRAGTVTVTVVSSGKTVQIEGVTVSRT